VCRQSSQARLLYHGHAHASHIPPKYGNQPLKNLYISHSFMKRCTNQTPLTTIPDDKEKKLCFASLYLHYGLHAQSFIVHRDGSIYPNPLWWRKARIYKKLAVNEVRAFFKGWNAGKIAHATAREVHKMSLPK
jgi:hypothetical protein